MATATILPMPRNVFYDANGNPLSGGLVYTFVPGGTIPATTWRNASETTPNSNPIVLDSAGSCLLYGSGQYQITVTDSLGNPIPAYSGLTTDSISINPSAPLITNYAALRARTGAAPASVYLLGGVNICDGAQGTFIYTASPATGYTTDNGGTVIVDASGNVYRRDFTGEYNAQWFLANPNNTSDSSAALAALATLPAFSVVYWPVGTYVFSSVATTTNFHQIFFRGDGSNSTILKCTVKLGAFVNFLSFTAAPNSIVASGMTIQGPSTGVVLGTKTANCDGVSLNDAVKVSDLAILKFDNGLTFNSAGGHITVEYPNLANNYYGIYMLQDAGDHLIYGGGGINGNAMAGIGVPFNSNFSGYIDRVHMGFQPYGIYQEAGSPSANFLNDSRMVKAKFEQIGNAAIYTENFAQACSSPIDIYDPGFSWGTSFMIGGSTRDYAVKLGQLSSPSFLDDGSGPFLAGTVGAIFVNNGANIDLLHYVQINAAYVAFGANQGGYKVFNTAGGGGGTLASGATSVAITGPPNGYPLSSIVLTPTTVGAPTANLFVYDIVQGATNWSFIVGALVAPTANITFRWRAII